MTANFAGGETGKQSVYAEGVGSEAGLTIDDPCVRGTSADVEQWKGVLPRPPEGATSGTQDEAPVTCRAPPARAP